MATDPAAMVTPLAHSGSLIHKRPYKSARFEIFRRAARRLMPLSTRGGKRSKGARETGEKGAFETDQGGEGEREREKEGAGRARDTCGRKGESRRAARGGKSGKGEGRRKKKERASCYTPRVCFSTSRHGDPSAFVAVMGWENSGLEALESPTLVGDTCLNDYPVERRRDVSIRRDFADPIVPTTTDF